MRIFVIVELFAHKVHSLPFASTDQERALREYFRLWRSILPGLPQKEARAYEVIAEHLTDAPGGVEYAIHSTYIELPMATPEFPVWEE